MREGSLVVKREEYDFACGLLGAMRLLRVERIPICGYRFKEGVSAVKDYLEKEHPDKLEELPIFFNRAPMIETYDRVIASIQMTGRGSIWSNAPGELDLRGERLRTGIDEVYFGCSRAFCEGARIPLD